MTYGLRHRMRQLLARERSRPSNYPVLAVVLLSWGALFADGLGRTAGFHPWFAWGVTLACFAAAIAMFIEGVRVRRSLEQIPHGHCRACGYNLTANTSGKCPECGTLINRSTTQLESPPPTT